MNKKEIRKEVQKIASKAGIDSLDYTIRADGRVELICEHGVGHPSRKLTLLYRGIWNDCDSIHGCDSCCVKLFPDPEDF